MKYPDPEPKVWKKNLSEVAGVQPAHLKEGCMDKFILGNVDLGGARTENLSLVHTTFLPGTSSGRHRHSSEESFFILTGTGKAIVGGQEFDVKPYDIFYAPKFVDHNFINTGNDDLTLLAAFSLHKFSSEILD